MARKCNGSIRKSPDLYKSVDTVGSPPETDEIFRGFEKQPIVKCVRFNIRPYLRKRKLNLSPEVREPIFVAMHDIDKYIKKCSVKIRRENLEQLKEVFLSQCKRNHVYTTSYTCNVCQKVYLSEEKLINHQGNKHVICYRPESKSKKKVSFCDEIIVHEVKEYHKCRKCPRTYADYNALKHHMKEVHKKRRCYVCFYCKKDFIDRKFFKLHIKQHCDACGLLLPDRKTYTEHRRNTCKIIKKYVCKTCHITLFYFMDLKDHSYEHLGNFYICDICKDRFDDKCALSHHIKFLHSLRRPKTLYMTNTMGVDRLYVCKFCDTSSIDREQIEKHVSTFPEYEKCAMTGYKDFYFCDQCFEKFSTETDMLQHKWSHFLKTAQKNDANQPMPVNLLDKALHKTDHESSNTYLDPAPPNILDSTTPLKTVFNLKTDKLPRLLQPRIKLEKAVVVPQTKLEQPLQATQTTDIIGLMNLDPNDLKKPIIEKKKTLLSKHQCQHCFRYFSTNYTLTRHQFAIHGIIRNPNSKSPYCGATKSDLRCSVCEEDFALPSLLQSHYCIRNGMPEPRSQDARPDYQLELDTSVFSQHNGFDDIDTYDYTNSVDFDIPAPIVELTEYDDVNLVINDNMSPSSQYNNGLLPSIDLTGDCDTPLNNSQFAAPLNNLGNNQMCSLGTKNPILNQQLNTVRTMIPALFTAPVLNHRPNAEPANQSNCQLNMTINNSSQLMDVNRQSDNVSLNGSKRLRYVFVKEVPIEF